MAKLGDDTEQFIEESMPFLFEKLGDTEALRTHECLTVAQCALLMPAMLTFKLPGDASEIAAHYIQLALLDIAHGELNPKHPQTLLPYSQYLRMTESGMFGIDGQALPLPTADWLVPLDEAERWLRSKDIHIGFDGVRADLKKMRNAGIDTWPDRAEPLHADTQVTLAPQDAARGITKEQVLLAFGGMMHSINLKKALGDGKGLFGEDGARTRKGTRGGRHDALWNPVTLAIGLADKYSVPMPHLKKAFNEQRFLRDWIAEWSEKLDLLGE
jgi:hypothetical protein